MKNLKIFSSAIAMLFCIVALGQEKNFIGKPYLEVQGKADTMVTPRGNKSLYGSRAMNYDTNIEFEKINISSEIDVRFALE